MTQAKVEVEHKSDTEVKKEEKKMYQEKRKIYKKLKEDDLPRLQKYESHQKIFGDWNSFSKNNNYYMLYIEFFNHLQLAAFS
ncbi:hypothetical protein COD67_07940 [Bacillus cereus]|nr:hypothetical protein COI89_10095 [Bacillus cereus]PGU68076.1 hypothetical protein COD67_07940 [Bacillus cereus]